MMDRRLIGAALPPAQAASGLARALIVAALGACASGETPGSSQHGSSQLDTSQAGSHGSQLGALAQRLTASERDAGEPGDAAIGPRNDCCTTSGNAGCSDETVAACVCQGDPFCCSSEYDALCVKQAVSRCGQDCDERAPVSDCCGPSGVPGCTDAAVAACICEIDPFCCVFRFDQSCVNLGVSRCNSSCGGEEAAP